MIRGMEGKRIFRDIRDRKDFVTRLGDLAKQPPRPPLVPAGEPGSWVLSREYEFSMAELAGRLGVCISAIAKALRKMGGRIKSVNFPLRPPIPFRNEIEAKKIK
jgi:hypothetical protein